MESLPWIKPKGCIDIAIIGDVILDEYIEGDVNRISPEAPVPVHLVSHTFCSAGGAANAARNVKLAGGEAHLFSIWGKDDSAKRLTEIMAQDEIHTRYMQQDENRITIRKSRITASNQQLARIDWERQHPIGELFQERMLEDFRGLKYAALLISDYGKGTLTPGFIKQLLNEANTHQIPSIVDPKGSDFRKYQGCTLITPNKKEACEALGLDPTQLWSGEELGRQLQKVYGLRNVLVTMGAQGMVLVPENPSTPAIVRRPKAREVFDVSGAGDTVVAIMALALASQAPFEEAVELANAAAGIVVEKWGTQPIRRDELENALHTSSESSSYLNKIQTLEQAQLQIEDWKQKGEKVVFTNGCFDILHAGHVSYLEDARSLGNKLVVGVNSDASIKRLKGNTRPILESQYRLPVLAGLQCVDLIVEFNQDTPLKLIKSLLPNILVKGDDWKDKHIVGSEIVKQNGGHVHTIKLLPHISTTTIIQRCLDAEKFP